MLSFRVHCLHEFPPEALADLRRRLAPGVGLTVSPDSPEPAGVDVLVAGRPPVDLLDAHPGLQAVVVPWAGVGAGVVAALAERPGIALYNLHHNAAPTAEYAVALLLAVAKDLVPADRQMRTLAWTDRGRTHRARLLASSRALVLGHGAIGRRVAQMLRGLGMTVTAVRRGDPGGAQDEHPVSALPDLLPHADVLMVTVPLTPETRGLIGALEFALLPPGAIVVNVARGPVLDQHALYDALVSGHLHGAGLDVWWRYPEDGDATTQPSDAPLHELPNVVMSPHRGGNCDRTEELRMADLADTLNALARGEEPPGRVNLSKGY